MKPIKLKIWAEDNNNNTASQNEEGKIPSINPAEINIIEITGDSEEEGFRRFFLNCLACYIKIVGPENKNKWADLMVEYKNKLDQIISK